MSTYYSSNRPLVGIAIGLLIGLSLMFATIADGVF